MSQKAILIGSRAFAWHTDSNQPRLRHRPVRDWDLVSSCQVAQNWLVAHECDILDIEQCFEPVTVEDIGDDRFPTDYCPQKYRIRLRNGAVLEWEISDFFDSDTALLDSPFNTPLPNNVVLSNGIAKVFFSSSTQLCVPDLSALILLKLSHIFWQENWRKTCLDILAFRRQFPARFGNARGPSAQAVIDSCESAELRQFCESLYRLRLAETASRWQRGHIDEPQEDFAVISAQDFAEFDRMESTATAAEKIDFIKRLVTKLGLELFLTPILHSTDPDGPCGSWRRDPSITRHQMLEECWLWALESICTNRLVQIPWAPYRSGEALHVDTEHLIQTSIYDSSPADVLTRLCSFRTLRKPVVHEKIQSLLQRYSGAFWDSISFDQVGETFPHVTSKLISTLIEALPELYSATSTSAYCAEFHKLVGDVWTPRTELPLELWQRIMIASDHLSLASLSRASKFMYNAANEKDARTWALLAAQCWSEERLVRARTLTHSQNGREIFARALRSKWESLAVSTWTCAHCDQEHESITPEEWQAYLDDPKKDGEFCQFAEFWCICPQCNAGSWSSCHQNRLQFL